MRKIALATANPAKAAALQRVAACLRDALFEQIAVEADERGPTFADNAACKALAGSVAAAHAVILASDGGLEIPALGPAWNALETSRFAARHSPAEKVAALLKMLEGLDGNRRTARWVESLAVAADGRLLAVWTVRGPQARLRRAPLAPVTAFWVDALLDPIETAPDHWKQLAASFAAFARERLQA